MKKHRPNKEPNAVSEMDPAEIEKAIEFLAKQGLLVDSGKRRWSDRTQSYQVVWVAREFMTKN